MARTGLGDGTRVPKDAARVEAFGRSMSSTARSACCWPIRICRRRVPACLTEVQHDLFDLGGELCIPGTTSINDEHVAAARADARGLQRRAAAAEGIRAAGRRHRGRGQSPGTRRCRRAERRCWALARSEPISPEVLHYLNRLSDLLFVLARVLARHERGTEVLWATIASEPAESERRRRCHASERPQQRAQPRPVECRTRIGLAARRNVAVADDALAAQRRISRAAARRSALPSCSYCASL